MANFFKRLFGNNRFAERDFTKEWFIYLNQYGFDNKHIKEFSNEDAYLLACSIAEIFYPIDYIADGCAGLEYNIVDVETLEVSDFKNRNLERLIINPNPWSKFSDLVYQGVFNKLSDGNSYDYAKAPDSYKNLSIDNIVNIWCLDPSNTNPVIKKEFPNPFLIKNTSELISHYTTYFFDKHKIEPKFIYQNTLLSVQDNGKSPSPLNAVYKNVNNLISVYSARYNVYEKNMNGGILSKKKFPENTLEAIGSGKNRDEMIAELREKNGLTGNKNFIGISSVPLEFIKTVASIAELQPFDETEADAIAIAGIYGIPSSIVPKKSEPKYSNSETAEKKVWQNIIKPMAIERGKELSKVYQLPEGLEFYPDFSKVEVLQDDKKISYESDGILIENLSKMKAEGIDVNTPFEKLKEKYDTLDI